MVFLRFRTLNMMSINYMFVFATWAVGAVVCDGLREPRCLSRFDYDYKMLSTLVGLESEQRSLKETLQGQQDTIDALKTKLKLLEENVEQQQHHFTTLETPQSGSTFIRWGRTSCPENGTELVYHGYAGGSWYDHSGGAAEYLCLPQDPIWGHFLGGVQDHTAYVFGAEYELGQRTLSEFFKTSPKAGHDDVPCAVCRTKRPSVYMIPARNQCYDGWTKEYHGYLVGGYHGHASAAQFVCLDADLEILSGGNHAENNNGKLFYFAESRCGSLPCPPYVNGRELTCVVCSK